MQSSRIEYDSISEVGFIKDFSSQLKRHMDRVGISQRELSKISKLNEGTISRYLSGNYMPSVKGIIHICLALRIDVDELIEVDYYID